MTTRWRLAAVAAAMACLAGAATADPGQLTVDDKANVFSPDGIAKAKSAFRAVEFKVPTTFTVVTYAEVPERLRAKYEEIKGDESAKRRFFHDWAEETAKDRNVEHGPFVLVSMKPGHVRALDDRQTDVARGFDSAKLRATEGKLLDGFKAALKAGDRATGLHDAALLDATTYVAAQLKNTTYPVKSERRGAARAEVAEAGGGSKLGAWICIGAVVLLVGWIAFGIIRAMTNRGQGGGGYGAAGGYGPGGGGYGGGYGGGGGGGFLPGLFGGLLGGAAGAYMYNNMFGGGSHGGFGGSYGDTPADGGSTGGTFDDGGAGDYAGGGQRRRVAASATTLTPAAATSAADMTPAAVISAAAATSAAGTWVVATSNSMRHTKAPAPQCRGFHSYPVCRRSFPATIMSP